MISTPQATEATAVARFLGASRVWRCRQGRFVAEFARVSRLYDEGELIAAIIGRAKKGRMDVALYRPTRGCGWRFVVETQIGFGQRCEVESGRALDAALYAVDLLELGVSR